MSDVLKLHYNYERKKGIGIASMQVRKNPVYNNYNFDLIRNDGTSTDFSYITCLDPPTKEELVQEAFRVAIKPQIMEFKRNFFQQQQSSQVLCPIGGVEINFSNCQVDHKSPKTFDILFNDFIEEHDINVDTISIDGYEDNEVQHKLKDTELEKKWIDYHIQHADLQVVSQNANQSTLNRGTRRSQRGGRRSQGGSNRSQGGSLISQSENIRSQRGNRRSQRGSRKIKKPQTESRK